VDPRTDVAELSLVQQRLVMIAVALVHRPAVLILDEPTASFTDREVEMLHETMRRLSAGGTGILFVSHRLDEVLALTDRVVVMRDGGVVAGRALSELDKAGLVELITGGEEAELVSTREADVLANPVALTVSGLRMTPADEPVSFEVRAGEVLGLAGLVGSGRSELLRAVYGADRRSAGTVEVAGRPVPAHSPRASIGAGMVMLTEDRRHQGLVSQFSVTRNMTLASLRDYRRGGLPTPSARREHSTARRLIRELAVQTSDPDAPVLSLSDGNQQKVVLGRWLAAEATVLLLDEPTVGVDVGSKADIQNQVLELAEQGLAVVVIASEFSQLEEMCHRVLVVVSGRAVQAELVGPQITEATLLAACFGASDNEVRVGDG
jgi:ABC-type sugar transport system ATPase subunit